MADERKLQAEKMDSDETVVGALNQKLVALACRSDRPLPFDESAVASGLENRQVPEPPSRRREQTTRSPLAQSDDEATTVLAQNDLHQLKDSLAARRSIPPSNSEEATVILAESDSVEDAPTSLWQRDATINQGDRPSSRSGISAADATTVRGVRLRDVRVDSGDVTTERALRLRQAQARPHGDGLVFSLGMLVGALVAAVGFLALFLALIFSGRLQLL